MAYPAEGFDTLYAAPEAATCQIRLLHKASLAVRPCGCNSEGVIDLPLPTRTQPIGIRGSITAAVR